MTLIANAIHMSTRTKDPYIEGMSHTSTMTPEQRHNIQEQIAKQPMVTHLPKGVTMEDFYKEFGPRQPATPITDPVNHPSHYTTGTIECIDAIEASMTPEEFRGYLKGCAVKYIWRYRHKGNEAQDLDKALWYLKRLRALLA